MIRVKDAIDRMHYFKIWYMNQQLDGMQQNICNYQNNVAASGFEFNVLAMYTILFNCYFN
jgi:hypothetical protein